MSFDLKNVRAMYQRLMDMVLSSREGINLEVYVDDAWPTIPWHLAKNKSKEKNVFLLFSIFSAKKRKTLSSFSNFHEWQQKDRNNKHQKEEWITTSTAWGFVRWFSGRVMTSPAVGMVVDDGELGSSFIFYFLFCFVCNVWFWLKFLKVMIMMLIWVIYVLWFHFASPSCFFFLLVWLLWCL